MIFLVVLVYLTGPDDQRIEVNPETVVTVREPRGTQHLAKGIQCLIHTTDGKFITVKENCDIVRQKLEGR
jgi:hypothetical protein